MNNISFQNILDYLKESVVPFSCTRIAEGYFQVASIFEPVRNGVYYIKGNWFPDYISDSVILLEEGNSIPIGKENIGIYVAKDPQLVFYGLLTKYFGAESNGIVSPLAVVDPEAVIGKNVQIDPFSIIGKSTIGDNSVIKSHCYVHDNSNIGKNVVIENSSVIGAQGVAWIWNENETDKIVQPQLGGVVINDNCFLGANTVLVRGSLNENSTIGRNTLIAPGCRIGHGTVIGDYVHFANNVVAGGNVRIGSNCFIGSSAVFSPKVKVHEYTIVGAGAVVVRNTTDAGKTLVGVPAKEKESKTHPKGMPKPKKLKH